MTLLDMRALEHRCAAIVVEELGAERSIRREVPGAPDGTRDYDIVFADDHEEPLEVTTNFDDAVMTSIARTGDASGVVSIEAKVKLRWMLAAAETTSSSTGDKLPFDRKRIRELLCRR